ncbi:MAG: cyclic peptide export ABC transporter [Pseudomonas sp.]|uniref:cyclic peptide export ABC transporter n=1 Tax=Pseudomonas sp. TaxID=306 RepID=UPI0033922CCF
MKHLRRLVEGLPRRVQQLLVTHSLLGAVSTTATLMILTLSAQNAQAGTPNLLWLLGLILTVLLFAATQASLLGTLAEEMGAFVHRQRVAIFQDIRQATPTVLASVGRQPLHAMLTRDTQLVAQQLPMILMGLQQAVLLVFVSFYLAYLSLMAFVAAAFFAALALGFHSHRMGVLAQEKRQAVADEAELFDGLRDMLGGFKELKLSRARRASLTEAMARASERTCDANSSIQRRWGRQYALVQIIFHGLIGIMVFVAPLLVEHYQSVAVSATTAVLFMLGPISTLAMVLPAVGEVENALRGIDALRRQLREALDAEPEEDGQPLAARVTHIELRDLRFRHAERDGTPGFAVGPISARFDSGQVTFITGGNGAGKSTLLQLLTGLLQPRSGQLLVNGQPLAVGQAQAFRDQVSAVFSDFHLFRQLYGITPPTPERAEALLDWVEMRGKVSLEQGRFSTTELSSGQRKRLALLLVELEDHPIIVLDEWAADQDPHFRQVFYEQILPALRARGKLLICVTHDDRYFAVADQVLHLDEGRLRQ